MRVHGAGVGQQWVLRLDHLEVDVRHVAEAGARIIRVATGFGDEFARGDVLAILDVELADVTVEKRDGIATIVA